MTTATEMRGVLAPGARANYALAGKSTITIRSMKTGVRFTFKIKKSPADEAQPNKPACFWVKLMNGSDNENAYQYLGTIFADGTFKVTAKSAISPEAPSAQAFTWLSKNWESAVVEVWHEGVCGHCGRKLTVPESIESGIGPVCKGRTT